MNNADFRLAGQRIWVAGHNGMVGSAIVRRLECEDCEILTVGRDALDLRRQSEVEQWMTEAKPDVVFLAAATVGGILANDSRPAEFIYDNLAMETNIIHGAWRAGVKKLLFLGSSCIYPQMAPQPMAEDALMTGSLEPTNQWYAVAKIAGIKLAQAYRRQYGCDFISAMPTNLYGPGDNFDLSTSHVIPALLSKAHEAKVSGAGGVEVWGTGAPRREFLYVEDLVDALVHIIKIYSNEEHVNIGTGQDITIRELTAIISQTVGLNADICFDRSKPDGAPRKLLDVSKLAALGWRSKTSLQEGLLSTYQWYLKNVA